MAEQLEAARRDESKVRVVVTDCAYICCSRTIPRSGYEQIYEGFILRTSETGFTLGSPGIGVWTYRITAAFDALLEVEPL